MKYEIYVPMCITEQMYATILYKLYPLIVQRKKYLSTVRHLTREIVQVLMWEDGIFTTITCPEVPQNKGHYFHPTGLLTSNPPCPSTNSCLCLQCFPCMLKCVYSKVSNNRTVSNKGVQGHFFGLLLRQIARFWLFLANSWSKINSRTCTFIQDLRVGKDHHPYPYLRPSSFSLWCFLSTLSSQLNYNFLLINSQSKRDGKRDSTPSSIFW